MSKYILYGVVLIMSILFFTSCERKYCYDCVTERYFVTLPNYDTTRMDSEMKVQCDQNDESIKTIEQDGTTYVTYMKNGKLVQEYTITKCKP